MFFESIVAKRLVRPREHEHAFRFAPVQVKALCRFSMTISTSRPSIGKTNVGDRTFATFIPPERVIPPWFAAVGAGGATHLFFCKANMTVSNTKVAHVAPGCDSDCAFTTTVT